MINSRKLEDLDPQARDVCTAHLALCHRAGIELIVTSTWRDAEAQNALYAIGRTTQLTRNPVTKAKAWQSWHQFKCAWDVVAITSGKPVWDANDPVWLQIVRLGKQAGAEAGADWKSFPDLPHFQVVPLHSAVPITLEQAHARFQQHGTIFGEEA
jgi:peptidoglycan L-alanyl-D-glutamate endopeptidase CwlK